MIKKIKKNMYNQYLSNVKIDGFVEKLSVLGVKPDDINDYLQYSLQFESIDNEEDKVSLLNSMFFDFQMKYPELNLELSDEIAQLYIDVSFFGNDPQVNKNEIYDDLRKDISETLKNTPFSGDFFDLGCEIGVIACKYINDKKFGLTKEDFIAGVKHGIKLFED